MLLEISSFDIPKWFGEEPTCGESLVLHSDVIWDLVLLGSSMRVPSVVS